MEITKERSIAIISAAVTIVLIGLYLILYRPFISQIKALASESKSIEHEVSQARGSLATLKAQDINKGIIGEADTAPAIEEITKQGKLNGITFISITPAEVKKSQHPQCRILPINMEVEGSYKELGIFLGTLDNLKKGLVTLKKFSIGSDEKNPQKLISNIIADLYISSKNAE